MKFGVSAALASAGLGVVSADEFNHRYAQGDKVNFYVHKVSSVKACQYVLLQVLVWFSYAIVT